MSDLVSDAGLGTLKADDHVFEAVGRPIFRIEAVYRSGALFS
jgi:hypothetical protein